MTMASSNIKLFDENKGNMLSDSEFSISNQRLNGLQTGVASSQLQNKAMYQASLVAYAIAQIMMQNGKNANDTDAVSAFVANLSGTMLQKVYDIATTAEAQAGVATGKWMSPALVKAWWDKLYSTLVLPVAKGGTGLTAAPSLLVNLGSTSAANVMTASPRPGVTGTLPVANGGTGQTSLGNLMTQLATSAKACRIVSGSYTGTGKGGSGNKCSINCGFEPKLVIVSNAVASNGRWWWLIMANPLTHALEQGFSDQTSIVDNVVSWSSTGVQWYSKATTNPKYSQLNDSVEYRWVAIG